jgi:hypothetical protein
MPAPYDYSLSGTNPGEALLSGLKLGSAFADVAARREAEQFKMQQQQSLANAMNTLSDKIKSGTATEADFGQFALFAPKDQAEASQKVWESMSKERQQGMLSFGSQVMAALGSQNPQIGIDLLNERAQAERNSGNENQAQAYERSAKLAELDPTGAISIVGGLIKGLPGGDKAIESYLKIKQEQRAQQLAPSQLKESQAKAETAATEAKFKEKQIIADLEKKAADLGLTKAQTGSAIAQTKKLGVETAKAILELKASEATGGIDPEKKFTQEEKIRKEWQGRTKVYGELQGTYNNIQASSAAGTGAGDIALITGFMKMLDPGSVVRETEFATARDTAGLFTQLENRLQKAQNGQLLQPEQRKQYVSLAKQYLEAAQKKAEQEKKDLNAVVKNYKLNPENIFGVSQQAAPIPAPTPSAEQPSQDRINQLLNKYGSR